MRPLPTTDKPHDTTLAKKTGTTGLFADVLTSAFRCPAAQLLDLSPGERSGPVRP